MLYESKEINRVVAYIESHLYDRLDVETLSKVAGYSPFHFSRLFKSATGESLGVMVKRLRLEQGAKQLYNVSQNITEVGMESGYNTPSSFTKAFKQRFDHAPADFKAQLQKDFEGFYAHLKVQPELFRRSSQRLLCCRVTGDYATSSIEAWQCLYTQLEQEALLHLITDTTDYYGLCYDIPGITEDDKMRYEAAISVGHDLNIHHERLFMRDLPAGSYAALMYEGEHEGLYAFWPRFYGWIQSQALTLANFAPIERYLDNPAQMLKQMPEKPTTELLLLLS